MPSTYPVDSMSIHTVLPSAFERSASRVTCIARVLGIQVEAELRELDGDLAVDAQRLDPVEQAQVLGRGRGRLAQVGDVLTEHREGRRDPVGRQALRGGERVLGVLARA